MTTTQFTYNGDGDRISQTTGGITTDYTLDPIGLTQVLVATTGGQSEFYVPGLAQYTNSSWQYFAPDRLGSVRQIVDPAGQLLLAQSFDPFGNVLKQGGAGSSAFGYTGEQVDSTGLAYLRARYYQPEIGRFLSADTIVPEPLSSVGWNRYAYTGNNPVRYTDPSGRCVSCIAIWIAMGLTENMLTMATGNIQDATVTSVGIQGGARVLGIGPVGHNSFDLVSNKEGQIQLFMTQAEGYYVNGRLFGDEETQKITDINGYMSQYNGILPQEDSFMTHQFDVGISKGVVNGGGIGRLVNEYGGHAMVLTGEVGAFELFSADATCSWSMEGDTPGDIQVGTAGVSIGAPIWPLPVGGAYYPVESQPIFAPFTEDPLQLPPSLIPICQVVGQCGN